MEKKIEYFETPGGENTERLIELVKERSEELGIKTMVMASVSGESSLKLAKAVPDAKIISVTHHAGFRGGDELELNPEFQEELEKRGIPIYVGTHALSGVGRGISNKFGGTTPVEVIAETLRMFSQGVKVCVEISIMAADAGLIPTDEEIIAIGGTARGVDSALVLKSAHMNNFFELRIREIIAMSRP
ncbi:MAG TPA: pyruvate kinase alpha/beta domain-containing protein [Methanobacteriaceae archaeon]|nr:pyruvate kinase alpha/beta domain-containing protein [Methanobacteriaceae archaeon]